MKFASKNLIDKILFSIVIEAITIIIMIAPLASGIAFIPFEAEWSVHGVMILFLVGIMISSVIKFTLVNTIFGHQSILRYTVGLVVSTGVLGAILVYTTTYLGVISSLDLFVICFSVMYNIIYVAVNYLILYGNRIQLKGLSWK